VIAFIAVAVQKRSGRNRSVFVFLILGWTTTAR
jgi:hypothetical protein